MKEIHTICQSLSPCDSWYVQKIPVHPSFVVRHQFGYCLHCFLRSFWILFSASPFQCVHRAIVHCLVICSCVSFETYAIQNEFPEHTAKDVCIAKKEHKERKRSVKESEEKETVVLYTKRQFVDDEWMNMFLQLLACFSLVQFNNRRLKLLPVKYNNRTIWNGNDDMTLNTRLTLLEIVCSCVAFDFISNVLRK